MSHKCVNKVCAAFNSYYVVLVTFIYTDIDLFYKMTINFNYLRAFLISIHTHTFYLIVHSSNIYISNFLYRFNCSSLISHQGI